MLFLQLAGCFLKSPTFFTQVSILRSLVRSSIGLQGLWSRTMGGDAAREPLLAVEQNNLLLHADCPGCKASYLRDKNAKAPVTLLIRVGYIVLCNSLPISVLYPFVYFMVRDFHVAKSDEDIGFYAGWIGSSFMAGRMCTGILWGGIADRYGRKPVIIIGLASVIIFNTLFGLSTSFWMALVTRFVLGCFNGMLGPIKAYASEICNEGHQALGVSVVGTAWGLGLIVGPALGGYLAQPAEKYPNIFTEGSLFARFPYLLQALCVSFFSLTAFPFCWKLPETLHKNHTERHVESHEGDSFSDDHKIAMPEEDKPSEKQSIFRNWPFMASTAVYCLWSLQDIAYTETFSLWAVSPKSYGGLSFTSSHVGAVLAVAGFSMLVFQLSLFPTADKLLGTIQVTRLAALLTIPLLAVYPFFSKIEGVWMYITVFSASILKYVLTVATTTGSFILINNTVKQHQRGAANGFSLSVVSLFKAIGPATGGIIFAWSQTRRKASFLPGDHMVFFFLNIFAFLTVLSTFEPFLPRSANKLIQEE